MKRSHAQALQLSSKLSGYVLYTVLVPVHFIYNLLYINNLKQTK